MLRASGIALDRAKRHPDRNYEFYAAEQGREMRRRIRQEQALDDAIKAGEFVPWYQPQVSLVDGSLIGLEALARRPGPSGELTAPAEFIQLAEETGLIIPLGELILMSRGLDLVVVAEGVETEAQARLLREMGCHAAQGYFYAPALPPARLIDWLRDRQ